MDDIDIAGLEAERDALLSRARTILMAAPAEDDLPEMGVTPVVWHHGSMFIYPSRLSAHVRAMLAAGKAAFLLIQDEGDAQNIWARKRIKFDSELTEIDRETDCFNAVCDVFGVGVCVAVFYSATSFNGDLSSWDTSVSYTHLTLPTKA